MECLAGKRKQAVLGSGQSAILFKSQREALAACKEMLGRYMDGETVNERDSELLGHLILRHPRSAEKIGAGIRRFFKNVAPKPTYGTSCFWLERIDGTKIDFFCESCVTGKSKRSIR
jgi:hypothetical protein